MNHGSTVFSQVIKFLPARDFRRCVNRYEGDRNTRTFSCWDQFLCMSFAQLTFRESLRDIEACLRALDIKLYHLGIRGKVSRTTLAYANEKRDWRIFADFGQIVIKEAQHTLSEDTFVPHLKNTVYALDSTILETCLALFPWSYWCSREQKGGVKAHTLLDIKKNIPTFIHITRRKVNDVTVLDKIPVEAGAFYVMDRAYVDFKRLYQLTLANAFFVTRTRRNITLERVYSHLTDKSSGVRSDQTVRRVTKNTSRNADYPEFLRRVSFYDEQNKKKLVFITNNFDLPAKTIADLYKSRWQIELFFKWLKQHLRIKKFFGNSENAVKTQIWIAATTYVLIAIIKQKLQLPHSLYTILQVLSVTILEKKPILSVFAQQDYTPDDSQHDKQLILLPDSVGQ